jgi:signal transduction histidine kinase/integral membrane sensor domain MASE1
MGSVNARQTWRIAKADFSLHTIILVCLITLLSYLVPKLAGALIFHPRMVWPLWPGCALLISALLLVPRRIWPIVIPFAFAAFVVYDLQAGVPINSIAWFIPADALQVLTSTLGVSYFLGKVPQLNSVRALSKYLLVAALLAPSAAAFVSAFGMGEAYWTSWRICFFSEALASITLTPAILGWANYARLAVRKSRGYYLELAAQTLGLVVLSYFTFTSRGTSSSPALLYSLVPFLLWSALRFGSRGVSTSVLVVAFVSIWGVVHGRGPFTEPRPTSQVLSLQLFLIFTATPFVVLAALVEERKRAEDKLREGEERLRLAIRAGKMYAFEWDVSTDVITRSGECLAIFNWMGDPTRDTGRQFADRVHPDDRQAYAATESGLTVGNSTYQTSFRVVRPDGSVAWLEESGRVIFDGQRKMQRVIGMVANVTERKLAEQALSSVSRRLIEAQEQERVRIARELHDDLGQRMALLQIGLEQLTRDTARLSSKSRQQLHEIAQVSTEVSSSIHNLSHQLHPYKLDTLGLVASLRGFFSEFSRQHNLQVRFVHRDIQGQIPKDVTLCLFRIVQEALRNVVKHSGAAEAMVELSANGDRIDLCVSDRGTGFGPQSAKTQTGLGLVSMRERLRLVGGYLTIESAPHRGTQIRALVPLSATNTKPASEGTTTDGHARSINPEHARLTDPSESSERRGTNPSAGATGQNQPACRL